MSYFVKNLRFLRRKKDMTQTEFAKKIHTNRAVIGSYEEGRAEPSIQQFLKICKLFKVNPYKMVHVDIEEGEE